MPKSSSTTLAVALTAVGFLLVSDPPARVADGVAQAAGDVPLPPWLEGQTLLPTYTEGAGLIYERRCTGCHRPDGLGPMNFLTHAEIRRWSVQTQTPMVDAVTLEIMPPWPPDPTIGRFANDYRLSRVEIDLLEQWIETGYPRGDGDYQPSTHWFEQWNIGEPDTVFELPEYTIPEDVEGQVIEFAIKTDFPEDRWVVAAEALPGDPTVVMAIDAGPLGSYQAVNSWVRHRPGTAWLLPADAGVRVRVHYRKAAGIERTDRSKLGIIFADDPSSIEDRLLVAPMVAADFRLDAGQPDLEVRVSFEFPSEGKIHSLMPVMHTRGISVEYTATLPDGTVEPLLSIPVWDPKWKFRYQLETPLEVPRGTIVEAVAHFDNSMRNIRNPDPWSDVASGPAGETFEGWLGYSLHREGAGG